MPIEFILYTVGLIGVSYYLGHQHGLRSSIEHVVNQMVAMKILNKHQCQDEDKK